MNYTPFTQVYEEDFDDEEVPHISYFDDYEEEEAVDEYVGYRSLYPPTVDEQKMTGVEPINMDGIYPEYLSEMLDPLEFPERYPGMPGYRT